MFKKMIFQRKFKGEGQMIEPSSLSTQQSLHQSFELYACLPFLELPHESTIEMGPVVFWPASRYREFVEEKDQNSFLDYLESIGQIKAFLHEGDEKWINTVKLTLNATTCISISSSLPSNLREFVLIDSLYLFYFSCTFSSLYYGNEIPSFNTFQKIVPASLEFIKIKSNWENLFINESYRENTVCIAAIDEEICHGFGLALTHIYFPDLTESISEIQSYKRLVRSIRYFIDRFFPRFLNVLGNGLNFSEGLFEPEDVIFLATSFEVLFDVNEKEPVSDLKHKLRPFLHLKYGGPLEVFWKWIDDFYRIKKDLIHGDTVLDPVFQLNPNFKVSHLLIGIKLFIYSICYSLYKSNLLSSTHFDLFTPPDFKWIHPEEILLFFWTEENLLNKINLFIEKALKEDSEALLAEIYQLTSVFVSIFERYYLEENPPGISFIPTSSEEFKVQGKNILDQLKRTTHKRLLESIHFKFVPSLEYRLK